MQIRHNLQFSSERSAERLSALRGRLDHAQDVALSGTDVSRPSDAAGKWNQLHGLSAGVADQAVWLEGTDRARDVLDTADGTLASATQVLNRAREVAVQLSNGTYSASERTAAADEVRGLREEMLGLANTRVGDRYLFAGDAYDAQAFDASGTYLGAAATSAVRVGDNQEVTIATDGRTVFQGAGGDVFQVLSDLEAALAADDPAAVAATLDPLEAVQQQLVEARQDVGFRQQRVDDAVAIAENLALLFDQRLSEATAVDPTESFTAFAQLQVSYQAALQVSGSGSGTKLFDYLK